MEKYTINTIYRGSATKHFDHYFATSSLLYDSIKNAVDTKKAQNWQEIIYLSMLYGFVIITVTFLW